MKLEAVKLFVFTSVVLVFTACGGNHKQDAQKDVPPADASADWSKAKQVDDNTVITDKSLDETTYEGADVSNAARATQNKTEDIPYADKNTQYVEEGPLALDDENLSAGASSAKTNEATNSKNTKSKTEIGKTSAGSSKKSKAQPAPVVPADKALGWLKNGNTRFVKRRFRSDGQAAADRAKLLRAQHPHSVIFSCSDSRVPPEIIFDQKLGEIYVVRTEGLAIDSAVIDSLERAVGDYGTQLLVVLTNNGCGAVASKVADQLITKSAQLSEKVNMGGLKIVPATYDLQSGLVRFE